LVSGPSIEGRSGGLMTGTLGVVKNSVGEVGDVSDAPDSVTVRGGMTDRPTKTPNGQIEGEDGSNVGTVRRGNARESEEGVA